MNVRTASSRSPLSTDSSSSSFPSDEQFSITWFVNHRHDVLAVREGGVVAGEEVAALCSESSNEIDGVQVVEFVAGLAVAVDDVVCDSVAENRVVEERFLCLHDVGVHAVVRAPNSVGKWETDLNGAVRLVCPNPSLASRVDVWRITAVVDSVRFDGRVGGKHSGVVPHCLESVRLFVGGARTDQEVEGVRVVCGIPDRHRLLEVVASFKNVAKAERERKTLEVDVAVVQVHFGDADSC